VGKVKFICSGCGADVMKHLSQLTRTDVVFCNIACRNKNYKKALPDWHPKNYKEYKHKCINCSKEFITNGRDFKPKVRSYCSAKCKNSHLPRKPHSENTKKKLSEKQIKYCKENGNQFSIGKSKGVHTRETISRISEGNSGQPPRWKGRIFEYNGLKLRSSYELFYAKYLDSIGIKWEYEPKFKLKDGRTFAPDFRLEDGTIVEIKGWWAPIGKEKWEMFCEEFVQLKTQVIMRDELVRLGMKLKKGEK
jgi:uncharacterized cysteine cluster protein YcgN (CxxCxxCC family)